MQRREQPAAVDADGGLAPRSCGLRVATRPSMHNQSAVRSTYCTANGLTTLDDMKHRPVVDYCLYYDRTTSVGHRSVDVRHDCVGSGDTTAWATTDRCLTPSAVCVSTPPAVWAAQDR